MRSFDLTRLLLLCKRLLCFPAILFILACHTGKKEKIYTIGFSQCTGADDWRKTMLEEMKRELSFHDNTHLIYRDADGNSEKQVGQIRELAHYPVDLLIVSPNEVQPLTEAIGKVYDSGIPVIAVDRRTGSRQFSSFIGASNLEVGQNAGRYAVSLLKGKGNVIEVTGIPDASPVIDRHKGFMDIISAYPGIRYQKEFINYSNNDPAHENEVAGYLKAHPDIDLVYAQNDFMALDIYKICKKLGIEGKIRIIGIDGLPLPGAGLDMVAHNYISATVLYPTGGQEAIQTAVNILEGKPYKKENQLFTTIIDSTNVRIMKLQNEKVQAQQKDIDRRQEKIEQQELIARNQATIIYTISISLALALMFGFILFYYLNENKKINKRLATQNEEISNQRNQLIILSQQAKEATDAKFNFFTNISHEFRTPLTLILAPLEELLANAKSSHTLKQPLQLIQKNVIRLLRLINQLIDFRKIEAGKMKLKATENDLISFINEIADSFKGIAQKRGIDLKVFCKEKSLLLWFDTSMIDKVIFNLLSNAFKFTDNHGYIHILVENNHKTNEVVIKVEDNGKGMSEDTMLHAFEPFYQGANTNQLGSGLGLSLSKELITLHHGSIRVASVPGQGTAFEIRLPQGSQHLQSDEIIAGEAPGALTNYEEKIYTLELTPAEKESDQEEEAQPTELSMLVVEDNPDLRNFLSDNFRKDFEVFVADNGDTAIQTAIDIVPDIIISDLVLPGKDGLYIANKLKNDIRTSHIPIILLTARSDIQTQIDSMRNLVDAYIAKPFNLKFLEESVRSIMKNRETLKEHYSGEITAGLRSQNSKKLDRKFINEFTSIVENNLSNDRFSVDDIATTMGISRVQLYRKVKALLDYNISDYILNSRLQKAKYYLSEDILTIAEIAYRVGFNTPAYFSTVFKSKFGITPKEFKKQAS